MTYRVQIANPWTAGRRRPMTIFEMEADVRKAGENQPTVSALQAKLIDAVAVEFEGRIRSEFIAAINAMTSADQVNALAQAIQKNDWIAIEAETGIEAFELAIANLANVMHDAFSAAGVKMADAVTSGAAEAGPLKVAVAFDRTNPAAVDAMKTISSHLSQKLQSDTAQAVQSILREQVAEGDNPAVAAQKIKQIVGLNAQQAHALMNYRAALESGKIGQAAQYSMTATDAKFLDQQPTGAAIPQAKIDKLVENYRKRLIAQRASTIARTESMSAVASGADQAWDQVVTASGQPPEYFRRFWVATDDDRTRPYHREIPLMNPDGVGLNEPFRYPKGTIMRPHDPAAPASMVIRCRCCQVIRFVPPTMVAPLPVMAGRSIRPD